MFLGPEQLPGTSAKIDLWDAIAIWSLIGLFVLEVLSALFKKRFSMFSKWAEKLGLLSLGLLAFADYKTHTYRLIENGLLSEKQAAFEQLVSDQSKTIGKLQKQVADANEEVATAETELATERSARLAFEQEAGSTLERYVTPRVVTAKQRANLRNYLSTHEPFGTFLVIKYVVNDPEAEDYALQLGDAFKEGGWKAGVQGDMPPRFTPTHFTGLSIWEEGPPPGVNRSAAQQKAFNLLVGALTAAQIPAADTAAPSQSYALYLYVGARPLSLANVPSNSKAK